MHEVEPWERASNYAGKDWTGWMNAGFIQTRDSDALERSNFRAAWKLLEKASPSAVIVHEGHWACGWVEWIAIMEDDERGLELARKLCSDANDYPVLDEDDLSALEQEEADELWRNCYSDKERLHYIKKHFTDFDFRSLSDMLGCARGKYFAGVAGELLEGN